MARKPHSPHNFRALSKPKPIKKNEHRHYLPFIPLILLIISTFFVSLLQPLQRHGVLAYATGLSHGELLNDTNQQRAGNGAGGLSINASLASAAQAKANDMVARNYWSHNTPDGQEPWVFMDSAGYKYQKAGENLAYGFVTSSDTITGWMNSPTHKANLLDTAFTEVGFGFANGENYNESGPETVVVAMYGKPLVLAASNQTPAPAAAPKPVTQQAAADEPVTAPVVQPDQTVGQATAAPKLPINTDAPIIFEPATQQVARIQMLTGGNAPWALFGVGLMTGLAIMALLVRHAVSLRHILRDSERFILHHPLLDSTLVSLVLFGSFMSQTTGFIR